MATLIPIEEIEVRDFREFCQILNIISQKIAGDDGTDEELIISELDKIIDKRYVLNFIQNKADGYFRIQTFI